MLTRLSAILALMALMLPVPATALAAAPYAHLQAPDCTVQKAALSSWGRPSPQALLLASADPQPLPESQPAQQTYAVRAGDTLGALARRYGTTVASLATANGIANPDLIHVGQRLIVPGGAAIVPFAAATLPAPLDAAWLDAPVVQGDTALLWLRTAPGVTVTGRLGSQTIPFHARCDLLWGLVAFDALNDQPGLHYLTLEVTTAAGTTTATPLPVPLQAGDFPVGRVNFPPEKQPLLDAELIRSENIFLNELFAGLTGGDPKWAGRFTAPLEETRITNGFGRRTVYDNGRGTVYHEGIDYRGKTGTPIRAVAPGTVVLAQSLTVRGNTVFIDHGAGVVTGYFHMSEIGVARGDIVQAGDVIGKVGTTGLSTGPHLHWEVRVNGRWVNPGPWLQRSFP